MKKLLLPLICACGAIALTTQIVLAQQETQPSTGTDNSQQLGEQSTQQQDGNMAELRFSKLQGTTAKSKDGQDIGKIEDILIDAKTGQAKFAILQRGGFAGMGGQRVPVPWQALNVKSERDYVVNIDQQKMQSAPTLTQDQYKDLGNPDYVIRVYRFYTIEPGPAMGAPGTESGVQSGSGEGNQLQQDQQQKDQEQQNQQLQDQQQQPQEEP